MRVSQIQNEALIMQQFRIKGLYAITPDIECTSDLVEKVNQVLSSGVRYVQYRNKSIIHEQRVDQAYAIMERCKLYGAKLIINDHLDVALAVKADGLHLGKADISIQKARTILGKYKLIGASCYNRIDFAIEAEREGADYVAFGAFYASKTKKNTFKANPDLLTQAKETLQIPIVAIGGIKITNATSLISQGCDAIAVSDGLFNAVNIESTAKKFSSLFLEYQ